MNVEKFVSKIGFSITLFALSVNASGFNKVAEIVIAAIVALAAIVLLFENISSKRFWKAIVNWADSFDITYIAFGLGLILANNQFGNDFWSVFLLLTAGAIFAGVGVAKLIGVSGSKLVKTNPKTGATLGLIMLIVGIISLVLRWDSVLESPSLNSPFPIVMVGVGIIFMYFGWRNWQKSHSTVDMNTQPLNNKETKRASQDLLLYWSPKTADDVLRRERALDHVASDQLWRASPGDTIWVVTVRNGELFLISRLYVDEVTNRIGAINRLGIANVWGNKKHYALAPANQIEPLKEASIASVADQIRFKATSKKRTKLDISSGNKVNAQQLQTMRILEESSVGLLKQVWSRLTTP